MKYKSFDSVRANHKLTRQQMLPNGALNDCQWWNVCVCVCVCVYMTIHCSIPNVQIKICREWCLCCRILNSMMRAIDDKIAKMKFFYLYPYWIVVFILPFSTSMFFFTFTNITIYFSSDTYSSKGNSLIRETLRMQ